MAASIFLTLTSTGFATPLVQVDEILMSGPTYRNDKWTLVVNSPMQKGPISSTVTYTVTPADEFGPNLLNAATNWVAAINADVTVSSLLSASLVYVASAPLKIDLTGRNSSIAFFSDVSVYEACNCDFNESEPLSASVSTISEPTPPTAVPLPGTITFFAIGLLALGVPDRRRKTTVRADWS